MALTPEDRSPVPDFLALALAGEWGVCVCRTEKRGIDSRRLSRNLMVFNDVQGMDGFAAPVGPL